MHPSMCLVIIYVITWHGSLKVNLRVLIGSYLDRILPHGPSLHNTNNHKTCIFFTWKPEIQNKLVLVQVTSVHDYYLAFFRNTWHLVISLLPQPWANIHK